MLKVKVDGSGIIPRGLGLAPLRKAVPMEKRTIKAIFLYPELKCKYMRMDGSFADLTPANIERVWKSDANKFIEIERAQRAENPSNAQRRKLVTEVSSINESSKKVVQNKVVAPIVKDVQPVVPPTPEKTEPIVVQSGADVAEVVKNHKNDKYNKNDKNNKNKNSNNWPESEGNSSVDQFKK